MLYMANFGQNDHLFDLALLEKALASRAETVHELAELVSLNEDDLREKLDALERLGFLERTGQKLSYRSPEVVVAERAAESLDGASAMIEKHLRETKSLLAVFPRLLVSWNQSSPRSSATYTEVFHGAFAATELWLRIAASRRIRTTDGILPDASRIFTASQRSQQTWFEAIAREDIHVRTLIPSGDLSIPGAKAVISADMAVGAEFRMLPDPPSWLWIADNDTVGLPFRWGDSWPTSVFATSDPAIVTLVRWLYDRLWETATSVVADSRNWEPLLALMSQGATLEAASQALGISARTGRRRIADALAHFKVDGLLALGVAWQRDRAGETMPTDR